jgi:hypothetical protein
MIHLSAEETAAANRVESSMRSLQMDSLSKIELAYQQPRRIRDRRRKNILKFVIGPKVVISMSKPLKVYGASSEAPIRKD